jgi:hypothetical protein
MGSMIHAHCTIVHIVRLEDDYFTIPHKTEVFSQHGQLKTANFLKFEHDMTRLAGKNNCDNERNET